MKIEVEWAYVKIGKTKLLLMKCPSNGCECEPPAFLPIPGWYWLGLFSFNAKGGDCVQKNFWFHNFHSFRSCFGYRVMVKGYFSGLLSKLLNCPNRFAPVSVFYWNILSERIWNVVGMGISKRANFFIYFFLSFNEYQRRVKDWFRNREQVCRVIKPTTLFL
jgi:hypothetical protein